MDKDQIIGFFHTKKTAQKFRRPILKKIDEVIKSGVFFNGLQVESLEEKLSKFFRRDVLAVGSGHQAIELVISTLGLKPGDEVLFPAVSYPTFFPIAQSSVKAVPVDCDFNGWMDVFDLERKITSRTKAIVVVYLYGLAGDMNEILKIASRKKLWVIEDCAQAFGTKYKGNYVGTLGDFGIFSFYPTKTLSTFGDGGLVVGKNKQLMSKIKLLRAYGEKERFKSRMVAGHSRLPEIQAAVINVFLEKIDELLKQRKQKAGIYLKKLKVLEAKGYLKILESCLDSEVVNNFIAIRVKNRDKLKKFLEERKIISDVHYPYLVSDLGLIEPEKLRNSKIFTKEVLTLPFYPTMPVSEINRVINTIRKYFEK